MKRALFWLPLLALLDLSGCGDSERTFRTRESDETGGGGGQSNGGTPGTSTVGNDPGAGKGGGGADSGKGGMSAAPSAGTGGGQPADGGDGGEDSSDGGDDGAGTVSTGGVTGNGGTAGDSGTGAMAGAPEPGGHDEPGECSPGDTRSCAEAGLMGACAEGTQACGDDGTWGECSITPEDEDTCEAGNDANCNGEANEGCVCTIGATRPCVGALGNCAQGMETCLSDGSGWSECSIQPEAEDSCAPGDDANCNGQPNEGCPCVEGDTQPCGPPTVGICRSGTSTCGPGGVWGDCVGQKTAMPRDCTSSADNDCDGVPDDTLDDVCKCEIGAKEACNTHPQDGVGICEAGSRTCVAMQGGSASDWGSCTGAQGPKARNCASSQDNDCDGLPDNRIDNVCKCQIGATEACNRPPREVGICKAGSRTCVATQNGAGSDWGSCVGSQGPKTADCSSSLDNDCDGVPDGGTGGPAFVKVPEGYCIDSTEVTRAQYQAWLDTNPSKAGQPVGCDKNDTFQPDATCLKGTNVCQTGCSQHPQVCIDWCDAYAYCQAVGKRLCGSIGGGYVDAARGNDITASQWYNACTSHGRHPYPYGDTFDYDFCSLGASTAPVASHDECQSKVNGYRGIYDLSGNVQEWEDACNGDNCFVRGGWYYDDDRSQGLPCNGGSQTAPRTQDRMSPGMGTGFRCCSR